MVICPEETVSQKGDLMPHVTLLHFDGHAEDLLARKERHVDPVTARIAPAAGGLVHLTAKTPDGLLVINVMADTNGPEQTGQDPDVAQALRESGLPQPRREHYELTRFVLAPNAASASTETNPQP
jgi:hypothetical protein